MCRAGLAGYRGGRGGTRNRSEVLGRVRGLLAKAESDHSSRMRPMHFRPRRRALMNGTPSSEPYLDAMPTGSKPRARADVAGRPNTSTPSHTWSPQSPGRTAAGRCSMRSWASWRWSARDGPGDHRVADHVAAGPGHPARWLSKVATSRAPELRALARSGSRFWSPTAVRIGERLAEPLRARTTRSRTRGCCRLLAERSRVVEETFEADVQR